MRQCIPFWVILLPALKTFQTIAYFKSQATMIGTEYRDKVGD